MNLEKLNEVSEKLGMITEREEEGNMVYLEAVNWLNDIEIVIDFIQNYTYLCDFIEENGSDLNE